MKRKCDMCDREATVTEVVVRNGQKIERHLCEEHAREIGITVQSNHPINELITKFVMSHSSGASAPTGARVCTVCGMTFAEFRQRGLLGCPECYSTFEAQLVPLLERAHEGGTHHVGKVPKRSDGNIERQQCLAMLRKQLSDAIAAEQYEQAAVLRDQLLDFERSATGTGSGDADALDAGDIDQEHG